MSHYSQGQCLLTCPEATAAALRELGFVVEVHQTPQNLFGYKGDRRPEKAHVIIRRQHVGSASNDIGFLFKDGKATAIISEYDSRRYNAEWVNRLTQLQGVHKAIAIVKKAGRRFERRVNPVGRPFLRVHA